jgi:hypothetical protein
MAKTMIICHPWLKTSNFCQKHSSNAVPLKLLQDPTHAIEHTLTVDFDGRLASYDWNEVDELSLAYAISVHKSQGSEFPAVVLPLVPAHLPDAATQPALHRRDPRPKPVRARGQPQSHQYGGWARVEK